MIKKNNDTIANIVVIILGITYWIVQSIVMSEIFSITFLEAMFLNF